MEKTNHSICTPSPLNVKNKTNLVKSNTTFQVNSLHPFTPKENHVIVWKCPNLLESTADPLLDLEIKNIIFYSTPGKIVTIQQTPENVRKITTRS